jgi:hypothetical protein
MSEVVKLPKVVGCLLCGYRTENPREIMLFGLNGCQCRVKDCTDPNCEVCEL